MFFFSKKDIEITGIQSQYVKIGRLNIHYYHAGQGKPLIIIHGGNSHAYQWVKSSRHLMKNHSVYIPDLPGFGLSQSLEGNFYISELTEFINDFSRALGLENFNLMGHSLGGAVAASYTLKFPKKVRKLILIDSLCLGDEIALWVRLLSTSVIFRFAGKSIILLLHIIRKILKASFNSMEFIVPFSQASLIIGYSAVTLQAQTVVLMNRLSEIIAPTLVIWGEKDSIVPLKHAYTAARIIPLCQLKIFKGGGHSAYHKMLPEFSQMVTSFLLNL